MFLASTSLPYSLYSLMLDEMSVINEDYSYRPDLLVATKYGQDLLIEALCNEVSNVSPISLSSNSIYLLPSRLFMKHFLGV